METTLQEIFRAGFEGYREKHGMSMDQYQAAQAIMSCQREELGHEEWGCANDGHVERVNHSCRHRSCPRCHQGLIHRWLEAAQSRLLPCDHYHVVFTLPHELNPIWHYNRSWCSDRLFKASSETLQQLLQDDRYLGAQVGLLSSLHTWGRTLNFHPHVHVLVTGGGISQGKWRRVSKDFLLPVGVLKAKFCGKWLSWLNQAYETGTLQLPADWTGNDWKKVLCQVAKKHWNVRIQEAYRHGRGVVTYLSRYVRGGPIKDNRLVKADGSDVSFRYRSHHDGKEKVIKLTEQHFISRVLWHVPVKGQHNLRYYGLYVPGAREKRDTVRRQWGERVGEQHMDTPRKERLCPVCGQPLLHRLSTRRKNSSIRRRYVQQSVGADRDMEATRPTWPYQRAAPQIFLSSQRPLN